MSGLRVEDLRFRYPGAADETLRGLSFEVPQGGSLALLGDSGAGKTTALNLLSGLLPCQQGRLLLDDRDVARLAPAQRGVSQVFQFPVLYESLSVLDNITFALRTRGVARKERDARGRAVAERFELTALLGRSIASLSLFEKQLVAFAKALAPPDLKLVLLDEPLTAVEPAMKWRVRRAVKAALAELGVTLIYVTHDQTEALTFADRVCVLYGGEALQIGTPRELFDAPRHVEVARFIGRPAMNLIPLPERDSAPEDNRNGEWLLGFRPDWARLAAADAATVPVRVERVRITGADAEGPTALVDVAGDDWQATVAARDDWQPGDPAGLQIDRELRFCDGWAVES
ncbi:MAG: ABC transporter ATP-binding protein [Pseudomonadota bacterium]